MAKKSEAMIGQKFGMLTVLERVEPRRTPNGCLQQMFRCKCDCGNDTIVSYSHLKYGGTLSCGCLKHVEKFEDLTGQVFNNLRVIRHLGKVSVGTQGQRTHLWECQCICGKICQVNSRSLKSGNTKSCGCIQGETLRSKNLNTYDLSGEYGIGFCSDGSTFYFDLEDYDVIKGYTWHKNELGYLITTYRTEQIRMHRLLLGLTTDDSDIEVDHKNHNPSDNRKNNLRTCTHQENQCNRVDPANNTSGHIGVSYLSKQNKYRAFIDYKGKYYSLGKYTDIRDAITARERAEKEYFAEFAIQRGELVSKNN